MALEPEVGLVGRDETAALFELLADRRSRTPLPVVVAFGAGGSGKTTLLDHVERRYHEMPIAQVNLDESGSKSCRDILDAVARQFRSYSHPQFGHLRLPRYTLAKRVLDAAGTPDDSDDPHKRARALIAGRMVGLPTVAEAVASVADGVASLAPPPTPTQFIGKLFSRIAGWMVTLAVVAPVALRWLLAGPALAATLRWYETEGSGQLLQPEGTKVDSVLVHMWQLLGSTDQRDVERVDRLLVSAFVADIRAAYRWRRYRKVNCLLLLDGADLLGRDDYHIYPPDRPEWEVPPTDFLELLAEAKLRCPDVPLLVVATKQGQPDIDDIPVAANSALPEHGEPSPVDAARARYAGWQQRFVAAGPTGAADAAYLPVRLKPFDLNQTRRFLAEWNQSKGGTGQFEIVVNELYEVTRGHPLAVRLTAQSVDNVYRRDRLIPSVRAVFAEPAPYNEPGVRPGETIGEFLLFKFLQRFRGVDEGDVAERTLTRELLAVLAAPRRLDVATIEALVPQESATKIWARLCRYSFVNRSADGATVELHPLLRDLLAMQLRARPAGTPLSHHEVHSRLHDYYAEQGRWEDTLYHALALGEVQEVASRIAPRIGVGKTEWVEALIAITEAPMPPDTPDVAEPWLRQMFGRVVRPSVPRPNATHVAALVRALWRLRSCTSTRRRTPGLYDDVVRAFRALGEEADPAATTRLIEYRRLLHAAEDNTPAAPAPPLPSYCWAGATRSYPRVWPRRNSVRRTAAGLTVVLLAGYLVTYAGHTQRYCDRFGVLDVGAFASSLWDDSFTLTKVDHGQCVGLTNTAGSFAYGEAKLSGDDNEVAELTRLIQEQNERVLAEHNSPGGRSYVTVVVATMLSSADEPPQRDLSAGVNELRGAYLAQRDWNQFADLGGEPSSLLPRNPLLRIIPANFGGNSVYAKETAERIKALAERDPTVIAVTGMGQSREETLVAADLLGKPDGAWQGIPVVGSVPSGTGFTGKPSFFRVAPTNKRQTQVAIQFALRDPRFANRRPYLFYDPRDSYSGDLKINYEQAIQEASFAGNTRFLAALDQDYEADTNNTATSLGQNIAEMCQDAEANRVDPLLVYTGRTNEVPTLLDALSRSSCGARTLVLGADDLSQLETANYADLEQRAEFVNGRLFFTTFGTDERGWQQMRAGSPVPPEVSRYFDDYDRMRQAGAGKAFRSPSNGHIMLAHDAVWLVLDAVSRVEVARGDIHDRRLLHNTLRQTTGPNAVTGVSGRIDFDAPEPAHSEQRGGDAREKLVVVQSVVADKDGLHSEFQFGAGW